MGLLAPAQGKESTPEKSIDMINLKKNSIKKAAHRYLFNENDNFLDE